MPHVIKPIPADLRGLALRLAPAGAKTLETLEHVKGAEHMLLEEGFAAELLHMFEVPSVSPGMSGHLIDLALRVDQALEALPAGVLVQDVAVMKEYARALRFIGLTGMFQQRFTIDYLRRVAVEEPFAEKHGIPVEDVEMTMKLLQLARKNSDGSDWKAGEPWR